uniref:Ninein-like n=1 Tax=Seriola dumerili TaxID=41447 RepID=A0A3B4TG11_SERDU
MEEAEHTHYVAQLKAEFDSCDTTATGFLDRDELTALCQKLQLDAHLPLLLDTLLGERTYARVNFEEFKEGFVAVLSRSLDFSTSEDDSSYLEPVPEEVKPKFVKGTKRYGRRSRPDSKYGAALTCDSEDSPPSRTEATDSSPAGVRRAKLRRSTSLESVEELDLLLRKLDADLDGRVSIRDFQKVLCGSAPVSCSTPSQSVLEERSARSTSPSLLTATVGQRILSRLDDGSGCTSPEQVIGLWTEEGIRNSRDILQTLDFPLEERLSLADLTLALDNELLVGGNGIHQAALISYKNEIQHLVVAEQACRERDKVKADLDLADQRNLQLVREVDDRHASMETLNQSRIDLEQDFRDRLTALRSQSEQESEALLQQVERERDALQEELQLLRAQEAELQEDLCDNSRLEEELSSVKMKLTEAESSVNKLQRDLDQLLHDKFGSLDPAGAGLSHEERFSEIVKEYELQCRDSDMKRSSSPLVRKKLQPVDETLGSLDRVSGPAVSIQTELALEQLKQKHNQELQQLHIQLETQVQRERAELEQNFAREISNLVQRLSSEKEQLEAELRLKMDQEVMLVTQLEEVRSENGALQERLTVLQQEVQNLEEDVSKKNCKYREEVLDLSSRNLQLSNDNTELSTRLRGDQESARMLRERLVENLQQCLLSLESEAELLRSQLHVVSQEKLSHAQEVTDLQRKLQDAHNKVEELENGVRKLMKEKEELCRAQEEQEEQASITLQEEIRRLRVQNQELQNKLQVQGLEVHNLTQEQQNLKTEVRELETARMQAQDQAARADTALSLVQAQHLRQLQQLRERMGEGRREEVELLQVRLEEEQRRSQQLEETLRLHAQQSSSQISIKQQDQYEKALASLQQRMEDLETKLKGVRMVLQEKVQQLKEQLQLVKNNKSAALLKDLYVENSQLMKALQVTEQRQKNAEKKNFLLEEKVAALNKLLREIVPASLAT